MNATTANYVANELISIFGTVDNQPVYSLGFQRMQKLSRSQRKNAFIALYFEGFTNTSENEAEFKSRLQNMTEEEFKSYKKNNK